MALMSDIIKKYQIEANKRMSDCKKPTHEEMAEKQELLDSIILSKGVGKYIPPADPDLIKQSAFKTITNSQLREEVKRYNSSGGTICQPKIASNYPSAGGTITRQTANIQDTVVINPGQTTLAPRQEDLFKKIARLETENAKLREELSSLKNPQSIIA